MPLALAHGFGGSWLFRSYPTTQEAPMNRRVFLIGSLIFIAAIVIAAAVSAVIATLSVPDAMTGERSAFDSLR